jgi:hypothetical protein
MPAEASANDKLNAFVDHGDSQRLLLKPSSISARIAAEWVAALVKKRLDQLRCAWRFKQSPGAEKAGPLK